jgi:hypothetical protein
VYWDGRDSGQEPGEGDDELLGRLLRHALEPGDAADREERDIPGGDAVAPRCEGVPKLVQDDAAEDHHDEAHALQGDTQRFPFGDVSEKDPRQQGQKRPVNVDRDSRNRPSSP